MSETEEFLTALFGKTNAGAGAELVAGGEIPHTDTRVDTTGRKQPTTKSEPDPVAELNARLDRIGSQVDAKAAEQAEAAKPPPPPTFEQALLARAQARGQAKAAALHHGREPDNRQPLEPIRIHPGGAPLDQ